MFKNKILLSITLSIGIFLLVIGISNKGLLYLVDKKIQNAYYVIHNKLIGNIINDKIVVVEIDNKTLQEGQSYKDTEKRLGRFPFDREVYIPVIQNLKEAGASIIAFDIIFAEESSLESDKAFSGAIIEAGNIILGGYTDYKSNNNKNKPIEIFYKPFFPSKYTGFYNPVQNFKNHIVYSALPFKNTSNGLIGNFSFSILKQYYSNIYGKDFNKIDTNLSDGFYNITPYKKIPLSGDGTKEILINYVNTNVYEKFSVFSFIDIYDKNRFDSIMNISKSQNQNYFKDKIVLIGASASGIKDIYFTPNGEEPGVYTHVNMLNTILTGTYLEYFDKQLEHILLFLIIIFSVYFNLNRSSYILFASNIFLIGFFLIFFPFVLAKYTYVILNFPAEIILSVLFSLAFSNTVKYLIENKSKVKLNKALSEYVSVDVAKEILSGEGKINLDGENKKIAIFFSDIEGFTSISEQFSPEELVGFLREYLSDMSDIIMDEKGFINKYEGDAIMALWGVFGDDENKTKSICLSALKQQEKLKILNKEWTKRGFGIIKARIGMHIGDAIIGNIGSEGRKMEFTALGDSVNLASRLEGVNKFYGTFMCVSEDIYKLEKGNFEFRYLDKIRVKGKEQPIKIYELLGIKGEVDKKILSIKRAFEKGIRLYLKRDFIQAKEIFEKLIFEGDNAGKMYLDMCEIYIKTPPEKDWEGISTMNQK